MSNWPTDYPGNSIYSNRVDNDHSVVGLIMIALLVIVFITIA